MTTRRSFSTDALSRAARALRFALIIKGVVRWGVLSSGGLLALLLVDNLLRLPQAMRLPMAVVLGGFILVELYRKVLVLVFKPFSPAHAARWLEQNRGIAGNVLINAYQFETGQVQGDWRKYVGSTIDSSGNILQQISPSSLWLTANLKKWAAGLVLLIVAWTMLTVTFPRYVFNGMERIFMPLADVPPVGSWTVEVIPDSHVTVVQGDKLDISVKVKSALGLEGRIPVPDLVWQNETSAMDSASHAGQHASMLPSGKPGEFNFSFSTVSQPFTFNVVADDSRSVSVRVDVTPLPQLKGSTFQITPPAYTGLKPYAQPGPPEGLEVPEGSSVSAKLELSPQSPKVTWKDGTASADAGADAKPAATTDMTPVDNGWQLTRQVDASTAYQLLVTMPGLPEARTLASGQITAIPDHPPEVDFVTQDRNRAVTPGGTLPVTIRATDDYGVASISLQIAPGDDPATVHVLKTWNYFGPPGQKDPAPENFTIALDPSSFTPGSTFLLTAQATDYSPDKHSVTSHPIIVRVAGLQDMAVPPGDALAKLFDLLKNTIAQQTTANGLTDNLSLHLSEALAANDVPKHLDVMKTGQTQAQDLGGSALTEAQAHVEAKMYLTKLEPLVKGEMDLAIGQIVTLGGAIGPDVMAKNLADLTNRQVYILNGLITLLGQMANDRQQAADELAKKPKTDSSPPVVTEEMAKLKDQLKVFTDAQKKLIKEGSKFKELNPEDLTTEQANELGRLAREEAKQAAFFQEKLTDLSKLALQDFADGKVVSDMNGVYQEVQKASEALYQKRTEIAVPGMTAGLEKAEKIEQNLERWLPNAPDNTKWSMEEPAGQQDVPLAELPKQLDDLIGDLMKQEQAMDQEKDDVSSSIMDSMDKGAGWGASDGPMSNMSAKGVTGNQLPNNDEISGRSGEGRTGKSDGQMVGDTAVGKGGNQTPTRMTSTPFENGSVNDKSKDTNGGATGGGKLAGAGQDGLRGIPPAQQVHLGILASQQSKLRQQAESLALRLRKQRRPTGDLESAINGMKQFEDSVHNNDGLGVVQGYHQALDSLSAARTAYAGERLSRVEADELTRDVHKDQIDTQAEEAPAGYEEMTGAYFRSLSEAPAAPAPDAAPDSSVTPASAPEAATGATPAPTTPAAPAAPSVPATPAAK